MSAPPTAPRVIVIILTWKGLKDLVPCLESFSCVDYSNYEVVVVDNGSEDDTVATVRSRFPWATLLVNESNLGYVGGNNVGIRYALAHVCDYVFILNNDTQMTPGVLSELVRVMRADRGIAAAGAKNLLMENPAYTWGKYSVLNWGPMLARTVGHFELDRPDNAAPKDVDSVIGNGCLMSREALVRVGLFDEAFFQVHEDLDWSLRARKLGYRVVYVENAAIFHKGGSSADQRRPVMFSYAYFAGRNAIMFARKHASARQWAKLLVLLLFGLVSRLFFQAAYLAFDSIRNQRPYVAGIVDGFRGRLRRQQTIGHMAGVRRLPPVTPFVRFLRWLGA